MSLAITAVQPKSAPPPASSTRAAVAEVQRPQTFRAWLSACGMSMSEAVLFAFIGGFVMLIAIGACALIAVSNPDAARWGPNLLSLGRGALETGVLFAGGLAMIAAIAAAGRGRRTALAALVTALLCGLAYLVMLGLDFDSLYYHRLIPGDGFRPNERWVARKFGATPPQASPAAAPALAAAPPPRIVDAVNGRRLFLGTCATCHGPRGEGMPGQGKDLRTSEFVHGRNDPDLLKFIIAGRQPWDPENTTKVAMPGRGGNPMLSDADLIDIVAHIRTIQQAATHAAAPASAGAANASAPAVANTSAPSATTALARTPEQIEEDKLTAALAVPKWVVPPPPVGPEGVSRRYVASQIRPEWRTPAHAQNFFGVYLFATQVAGAHVLIACIALGILAVQLLRRRGGRAARIENHRMSILMTGVLWWWTTASWACMFFLLHLNR